MFYIYLTTKEKIMQGLKAENIICADNASVQTDENTIKAEFDEPQRAVTKGQALVLYDGDTVVGGGTIC